MQASGAFCLALDAADSRNVPRLLVLGTDFQRAGIDIRERLAISGAQLPAALRALRAVADEGLILSTCNRTEVYAIVTAPSNEIAANTVRRYLAKMSGVALAEVERDTHVIHGRDALRHMLRVACGLESVVLGEPQILGQIRASLAEGRAAQAVGPILSRLATDALRIGKLARTATDISRNRLSIPHAAIDLAERVLPGLRGRSALVVGAGEMGTLTAKLLRAANIGELTIANRTLGRAELLAATVGGRPIALANIPNALAHIDVAFGAAGPDSVGAEAYEREPGKDQLVLLDLGLPRTFAPALGERANVRLFDLDDLAEVTAGLRETYSQEVVRAERLVDEAIGAFVDWLHARAAAPAITALRQHADEIRQGELERALARLGHLSPRDREVVAALSVGIVNKLLHTPMVRMQASEWQEGAISAAQTLFGLDGMEGATG